METNGNGMPNNLVLIRHGESEGNIAVARSKAGDHSDYKGEFAMRHSSKWRLSGKGRDQANITGQWIDENLNIKFDRFYTSEYIRAMETAALLNINDAKWYAEFYLRERNWGILDRLSFADREARFAESMEDRGIDPFYWTPPNGESLATLCLRIDRVIQTLHRECSGKNVLIVCHGEVMWAFRVRLERMMQETFYSLDASKKPSHRIHNCQIIHYTRTDPRNRGESMSRYLNWVRSICPWKKERAEEFGFDWTPIHRPSFHNIELLNRAEEVPVLVK